MKKQAAKTIKIDPETHQRLKVISAFTGATIGDVLRRLTAPEFKLVQRIEREKA